MSIIILSNNMYYLITNCTKFCQHDSLNQFVPPGFLFDAFTRLSHAFLQKSPVSGGSSRIARCGNLCFELPHAEVSDCRTHCSQVATQDPPLSIPAPVPAMHSDAEVHGSVRAIAATLQTMPSVLPCTKLNL